jgi:hypothetical protein
VLGSLGVNLSMLAALPLLAVAPVLPRPVPLGIYTHCTTSKYGKNCDPTLQVAKGATRVSALTAFPACSPVPLKKAPSAKIVRGRFRIDETERNVVGKKVKVAIAGHVLTRRTIRVSYRLSTATCKAKTRTITLTFSKVGKPGEVG